MNEVLRLAITPTAVIPVDIETTAMLAAELRRLYRENQFVKHDLYDCAKACEQIAAAEREQCARVAEKHWDNLGIGQRIAAAIRSRT